MHLVRLIWATVQLLKKPTIVYENGGLLSFKVKRVQGMADAVIYNKW